MHATADKWGRGIHFAFLKKCICLLECTHVCVCVCECVFHICVGEKTICRHWIYQVDPEDAAWVLTHSIKCLKLPTHPLALKAVSKGHIVCTMPFRMKELPVKQLCELSA